MRRDLFWLFAGNAARMTGYGMLDVMFALYLVELGFDAFHIGLFISATLLGSAGLNLLVTRYALRLGRKRTLILLGGLTASAGLVLIFFKSFPLLVAVGLLGTLNFTGATNTSFAALDQSILAQIAPIEARNRTFGRYNTVALLARMAGALLSGLPSQLRRLAGMPLLDGYRGLLFLFFLLGVVSMLCSWRLSGQVELEPEIREQPRPWHNLTRSRKFIARLSLLFGVDALATGFIPQSLIVLWFSTRFGVGAGLMGPLYSGIRLLQAGAYPVAMRLADRFGLLNIIVFSHLPSQLLLFVIPFSPTLGVAIALLMVQQAMSHMDIPTRQAYIVAVVAPEERTAAVGLTNLVRNLTQGVSPSLSGLAFKLLEGGLSFACAGALGTIYDLLMYFSFRSTQAEEAKGMKSAER